MTGVVFMALACGNAWAADRNLKRGNVVMGLVAGAAALFCLWISIKSMGVG